MLLKQALSSALQGFFQPQTMPGQDALQQWISAYITYAQAGIAGGTSPIGLTPSPTAGGNFFDSLDSSLNQMWMSVPWVGPGIVGKTFYVPPLSPSLIAAGRRLITEPDAGLALQLITEAFHTYTLSITVTVVTAGVTSLLPLT